MNGAALDASGVTVRHRSRAALDGVDLDVQGGVVTLLGANGAGKSTLLRCLATIAQPDEGRVTIDGLDPRNETERIEIRRRLGHVPQDVGFPTTSTVFDVVDYFGVLKGFDDDRRRRREVYDVLDRVGLVDRLAERVATLSGGMRRRLAVAQALLGRPTLLILDEPSAGLDPDERQRLRDIMLERASTATVVVSTHLTEEAALGGSVVVLHDGRVRFSGTPAALAHQASGSAWVQPELPAPNVRSSWRQPDGHFRCLGTPPRGAQIVEPTIEDGYLLLTR